MFKCWKYLRAYAKHFNLLRHTTFNCRVDNVQREDEEQAWKVTAGGEVRRYSHVIIANGHHWSPKFPDVPGTFNGDTMHSAFYRTPDIFSASACSSSAREIVAAISPSRP